MNTKEIMTHIDKKLATGMMIRIKAKYSNLTGNEWLSQFRTIILLTLTVGGIDVKTISESTANSVLTKLEKKAGIYL